MTDINVFPALETLRDETLLLAYDDAVGGTVQFSLGQLKAFMGATGGGGSEPPIDEGMPLTFQFPKDTYGIISWIGTNEGTEAFSNPLVSGKITASSNFGIDQNALSQLFNRTDTSSPSVWNGCNIGDWLQINFGNYLIKPNKYVLVSWHNNDRQMRNWAIQFSVDGSSWETLDNRSGDISLNGAYAAASFATATATKFYKFMRFVVTGADSNGAVELVLSEIELYGSVKKVV